MAPILPDNAHQGHVVLEDAEWLYDDDSDTEEEPDEQNVDETYRVRIMVPVGEVRFVEFISSDAH